MSAPPESGRDPDVPTPLVSLARRSWIDPPPTPLNPIIGRQHERASAAKLVHDGARLVTLVGSAGMGKTRLALQLAADLKDAMGDGVAWVPLAAVRETDLVLPAIAEAVRIDISPNTSPLQTLNVALRDARFLLLLDNFEQVLPAGEHIAGLLEACSGLVIVATSRSPLRVTGEHVVTVLPLSLSLPGPRPVTPSSPDSLAESEQLFIERARAIAPELALDVDSVRIVSDICRHLEGIPLAIELAAARVNLLPLPALRARLERRLPLLASGARGTPRRHHTMHDAIAWSYDLLDVREQAAFRRLAVYSGGFRLAAVAWLSHHQTGDSAHVATAERVSTEIGDLPEAHAGLLERVATLVDHSLLQRTVDPDGEPRFVMLETVRAFAMERLDAHGERESAERARADYLVALAEQAEIAILLPEGRFYQALVELEHEDFRTSLAWLHANGEMGTVQRLSGALARSWFVHGRFDEGARWLEVAVASGHQRTDSSYAKALVGLALFVGFQGDGVRSEMLIGSGLDLMRAGNAPAQTAVALLFLGGLLQVRGDHRRAEGMFQEALDLAVTIGDDILATSLASSAITNLGVTAHSQGKLAQADAYHQRALALSKEIDHAPGTARVLRDLGDVARDESDLGRALDHYRQGLELAAALREPWVIVDALRGAAFVASAWEQAERAAKLIGAADALQFGAWATPRLEFDQIAHEHLMGATRAVLGDVRFAKARAAGAAMSLADAVAEVEAIATPHADPTAAPANMEPSYGLTPREIEILQGIVGYQTDREIAESLFISPRTVSWYVTRILAKLGVDSRRRAATKAIDERLI